MQPPFIVNSIKRALTISGDLRLPEYQGSTNIFKGHCYIASEAIYHLANDGGLKLKPMFLYHENSPHWYLMDSQKVLDPTKDQFFTSVDYTKGKGKGFLTEQPSKRATELIRRATTGG